MPTKKRRVGFIPRKDVLDLINKLSIERNLSNSKIINILVEEALYKRGMLNIKNGNDSIEDNKINLYNENLRFIESREEPLDMEIYSKFVMFLQFQEKMKSKTV